ALGAERALTFACRIEACMVETQTKQAARLLRTACRGCLKTSGEILAAIGGDRRAGDEAGLVRRQEDVAARDLFRLAEAADRNLSDDRLPHFFRHGHDHVGGDVAGADDIDSYAGARPLLGER